jgi:signal transduction histidine kinase
MSVSAPSTGFRVVLRGDFRSSLWVGRPSSSRVKPAATGRSYSGQVSRSHRFLRRYGDLALALLLALWMTADLLLRPDGRQVPAVACGLLATVPLAGRRRLPVLSFLLALTGLFGMARSVPAAYDASAPFLVVSVFAVFSLGAHATGRQFWAAVPVVGFSIVLAALGEGSAFSAGTVMFFLAFIGTPWAAGVVLRLYRERQATESARTAQLLIEQAAKNERAVEEERAQIARDLHDVVSHAMAVTLMQARGGRRMLTNNLDSARAAFDAIERTNTQALGDMRRLLNLLRPADENAGSPPAPSPSLHRLAQLASDVRASGVVVELLVSGDIEQVPPGVGLSAYRVIQEALTNVLKHAGPDTAAVEVDCGTEGVRLVVSDNGTGGDAAASGGHGLAGIRERVAVLGGEVRAGPGPVSGFVVSATLPYQVPS